MRTPGFASSRGIAACSWATTSISAPDGPRLIEINTNAGGALLNGLHTASLCDPERLSCICADLLPVETMQARIVRQFISEFRAVRGPEAELARIAIVDERPREQFLFPEFELLVKLFEQAGIRAEILDTEDFARDGEELPDLVYLRDTDFTLATPRTRGFARRTFRARSSSLPRRASITCSRTSRGSRSSRRAMRSCGSASRPRTPSSCSRSCPRRGGSPIWVSSEPGRSEAGWCSSPARPTAASPCTAATRSRAASSRRSRPTPGFLAQRRVEPGEVEVETLEGRRKMKFDVRAYAYRDQVLLLGARVYQGQVTNLRSPGGGFSAICVSRAPA